MRPTSKYLTLLKVFDTLFWSAKLGLLPFLRMHSIRAVVSTVFKNAVESTYISEKLLGGDLGGSRCPVLDPRNASQPGCIWQLNGNLPWCLTVLRGVAHCRE